MASVPPLLRSPLRLDAAVAELLAQPIEPAHRGELAGFQDALAARVGPADMLDPPNLAAAAFAAVLPRLSDPGVLRLERRRALLERLAARVEGRAEADPAARGGLLALRRELAGLSLLRRNRDSLIEG